MSDFLELLELKEEDQLMQKQLSVRPD